MDFLCLAVSKSLTFVVFLVSKKNKISKMSFLQLQMHRNVKSELIEIEAVSWSHPFLIYFKVGKKI